MKNVMLDLETMGTSTDAAIIAIGACEFDIKTQEVGEKFYHVVDLQSSVDAGLTLDASTVIWWMKQSDQARKEFQCEGINLSRALVEFTHWIGEGAKDVKIWGNGAAFDNAILSTAYRKCKLIQPWSFWNDRCYRTQKADYPDVKMQRKGDHHNALDDAISQAEHLIAIAESRHWVA